MKRLIRQIQLADKDSIKRQLAKIFKNPGCSRRKYLLKNSEVFPRSSRVQLLGNIQKRHRNIPDSKSSQGRRCK